MCEEAPESAHHSVEGVRQLVASERKTLALTATSEMLAEEFSDLLAVFAELLGLEDLFLELLALALALSCSRLDFLLKQESSECPALSHQPHIREFDPLNVVAELAAAAS
jgi:hypothetical protein